MIERMRAQHVGNGDLKAVLCCGGKPVTARVLTQRPVTERLPFVTPAIHRIHRCAHAGWLATATLSAAAPLARTEPVLDGTGVETRPTMGFFTSLEELHLQSFYRNQCNFVCRIFSLCCR